MKWLVKAYSLVDDEMLTWEVDADNVDKAMDKGRELAQKSSVADPGSVDVELLEEDKQLICDRLVDVLKLTRGLCDVIDLEYDKETETVTALFETGYTKKANVACDSGTAMIRDIIRQIQ